MAFRDLFITLLDLFSTTKILLAPGFNVHDDSKSSCHVDDAVKAIVEQILSNGITFITVNEINLVRFFGRLTYFCQRLQSWISDCIEPWFDSHRLISDFKITVKVVNLLFQGIKTILSFHELFKKRLLLLFR